MILARNNKKSSIYSIHNKVQLIRGGKRYFELFEQIIGKAKHTLHLQVYIFNEDETGNRISESLIAAAKKGVKIYIVADGYASKKISVSFINNLKAAGVNFRWFNPIFKSRYLYFGRRLHHKVVVADAFESLVGGINITDRYNDLEKPAWLDWAVYVQGEISQQLNNICADIWNKSHWGRRTKTKFQLPVISKPPFENCFVRARVNDWVRNKNQISRSYIEMLTKSEHSITIMSSYFLPGVQIKKNIIAAVKRGVKIKLIVAGVSDVPLAKNAERYMYRWVLKNNIELHEYAKTVLHGKLSVCDNKWATIGSYNINNISAYASIELNLDILNAKFARKTEAVLQRIIDEDCVQVTEATFNSRSSFLQRMWERTCYYIYRLTVYLFTFYFKKRHG